MSDEGEEPLLSTNISIRLLTTKGNSIEVEGILSNGRCCSCLYYFNSSGSWWILLFCNALLFYGHLCMRGSNNICDVELWG